jgi:hypothetical protein
LVAGPTESLPVAGDPADPAFSAAQR